MHPFLLAALLALPIRFSMQALPAVAVEAALKQSLTGSWVGVLEYRDYSEPATSTRRVDLPTWLTITALENSMKWRYVYDDGANKVLEEADEVTFNVASGSFRKSIDGKPATIDTVEGLETLRDGRGVLVLHGTGTDNNRPSEMRTTMSIRRNLLELVEEVRPAGSSEAFVFRHLYRFTRAQPPAVTR